MPLSSGFFRFADVLGRCVLLQALRYMFGGFRRRSIQPIRLPVSLAVCSSQLTSDPLLGDREYMAARERGWQAGQTGALGSPRPALHAPSAQPVLRQTSMNLVEPAPLAVAAGPRALRHARLVALAHLPASIPTLAAADVPLRARPVRRRLLGKQKVVVGLAPVRHVRQVLPPKRGAHLPAPILPLDSSRVTACETRALRPASAAQYRQALVEYDEWALQHHAPALLNDERLEGKMILYLEALLGGERPSSDGFKFVAAVRHSLPGLGGRTKDILPVSIAP